MRLKWPPIGRHLAPILLALPLTACTTHLDRDPLAASAVDPGAFSVPITTLGVIPF